jgi:hypothetical protein
METTIMHCTYCHQPMRGRRDKKFCSDQCRATHHNLLHADALNDIRRINNAVRRNRGILARLNTKGRTRVHKSDLINAGLNFDYITQIYRNSDGKPCYFCYDQGYQPSEGDYFELIERSKHRHQTRAHKPIAG